LIKLGRTESQAAQGANVVEFYSNTIQSYKIATTVVPLGAAPEPADPGVRGAINPLKDKIVFREYSLSRQKINDVSPFNQQLSDSGGSPIRVVVAQSGEKYILQGNNRVFGGQEQKLQSLEGLLYTEEQWEEFSGSPFDYRGTNNPRISP
jgi:hypothetical protein